MERIDGGAVSANLLGECMYHDPTGSQNKRNVGDGPQDVKPKVVFLARNLSVITTSNAKLCSERSIRGEGCDYHGRLNAATAAELQEQGARRLAPRSKTLTSNRKIGVLSGRTERRLAFSPSTLRPLARR